MEGNYSRSIEMEGHSDGGKYSNRFVNANEAEEDDRRGLRVDKKIFIDCMVTEVLLISE
jgi:hypothetical protein